MQLCRLKHFNYNAKKYIKTASAKYTQNTQRNLSESILIIHIS